MEYDELMNAYKKLQNENKELQIKYDNAVLEINSLRRMIFGSKRERTPNNDQAIAEQCSLFEDEKDIEKNVQEQIAENVEEIVVHKKKKAKKKTAGIKKSFLKDVVVRRKEFVLNEEEKCPDCDSDLKLVGKKVVRQEIDYIPPTIELVEYIQYIYKCTKCGTEESEKETPTFVKSELPKPLLTHSFASPALAAEVIFQKYYLGVPLYRQEQM